MEWLIWYNLGGGCESWKCLWVGNCFRFWCVGEIKDWSLGGLNEKMLCVVYG